MEIENRSPEKISQPEEIPNKVTPAQKLLSRVAQSFEDQDVGLEILEKNKVSDALTDFIEPYVDSVKDDKGFTILLDLATIAWNLSFFSKKVAQKEIKQILEDNAILSADTEKETKEDFKNILGQMIARKKRHFSKYKRFIIDYELKDKDDGFELFVISTPIKNKLR